MIIWARKKEEKKKKEKNDLIFFFSLPTIHSILEHILHFTIRRTHDLPYSLTITQLLRMRFTVKILHFDFY